VLDRPEFHAENVMADVCLGVTIVGTECLLAIGSRIRKLGPPVSPGLGGRQVPANRR
jgi:hypothetical protein